MENAGKQTEQNFGQEAELIRTLETVRHVLVQVYYTLSLKGECFEIQKYLNYGIEKIDEALYNFRKENSQ